MSTTDNSPSKNLDNSSNVVIYHPQTNISTTRSSVEETKSLKSPCPKKIFENSRSSDSGKSSSCSPILLDCSFDSGIAGVVVDSSDMQLHKRIQQCQCILLALERDREYFFSIRNRLSKISNRKKKESNENEFFCNVCCAEIDPEDEKTFIKCYICEKYICRGIKCAKWLPKLAKWECELCESSKESLAQTSSWVADQITFHQEKLIHPPRARSEIYIPISECNDSSIHFESVSQIGANSTAITAEQKLKIREYVEEVVASLLGGNLDKIAVNQLSKSENYLPDPKGDNDHNGRMSRESVPIRSNGNDFTDVSETRLRQMIQKIIAETMNLPSLSNGHAVSEISLDRRSKADDNRQLSNGFNRRHRTEHYFEPTIYQDLLATAVLNKIVDKRLNNNQEISGNDTTGCDDGAVVDADNEINDNVRLEKLDRNFNNEKLSTTSGSSVEPHSDCSYPEIEQILNTTDDKSSELLRNSDRDSVMSDYLASHLIPLPDLNALATESDEDDYMSVTSSAVGDGTWEKNWLFKKKRTTLSGSVTGNSGVMLVPDPKEDVRAQIGDKTTDEISDLSELGSDTDDSLDSLRSKLEPINDRLINKHLIGGQNSKMILDELIERSSMISNTLPTSQDQIYTDACNEHVVDAPTKNEAINDNVTQQKNTTEYNDSVVLKDPNSNTLTGSIAEREYKKWYNAVEMPNNPYAPEALKRRISGSQERFIDLPNISPTKDINTLELLNSQKMNVDENVTRESDYKRYSRDYYINSSLTTPQMSPARDVSANVAKDNREHTKKQLPTTEIEAENDLYKAIPAQVEESENSQMSADLDTTNATTTSDSDTIKLNATEKQKGTYKITQGQEQTTSNENKNNNDRPSSLALNTSEGCGNVITPTRGTTPIAFKFLQPKRKILEPSQVLSVDEDEQPITTSPLEKPVIEAEVAKALPSVKALARAFLMTTNSTQPDKLWLRKARTLSQGNKKRSQSPKRSLDIVMVTKQHTKVEDDLTITSDLSSLETDSSSVGIELSSTPTDMTISGESSNNPSTTGNISPVPVREGVLKNNIAFFENLKNK